MTITQPQAQALANLIHEIRPDWPTASLMTLLAKNQNHSFPELCKAALNVATDTTKRTPAIIFMDGPHWPTKKITPASPWSPEFNHGPAISRPQQFKTATERSLEAGAALHAKYSAIEEQIQQAMATGTKRAAAAFELANQYREQEAATAEIIDEGEIL